MFVSILLKTLVWENDVCVSWLSSVSAKHLRDLVFTVCVNSSTTDNMRHRLPRDQRWRQHDVSPDRAVLWGGWVHGAHFIRDSRFNTLCLWWRHRWEQTWLSVTARWWVKKLRGRAFRFTLLTPQEYQLAHDVITCEYLIDRFLWSFCHHYFLVKIC